MLIYLDGPELLNTNPEILLMPWIMNKRFLCYLVYFILYFEVNCLGLVLHMNQSCLLHNFHISIQINYNNSQFPFHTILSLLKDIHFHHLRVISLSTSVKRFIKTSIGM